MTLHPSSVQAYRDLAYVQNGHKRQRLDLFVDRDRDRQPLIIWIHGGAFRMGSKEDDVPLEYLAKGYAIASLNYRLSQHALFPAQIEDCKAAVRFLRAHAEEYRLDPQRFAAWGSSAGGHLVAMLGTTGGNTTFDVGEHLDCSSRVQAVIDYFGPTDFLQMDRQRLPHGMLHDTPDSPESQLVGGPIQQHPERVAQANPITHISGDLPPFLIIHGDSDPLVPYQQSVILHEALQAAGGQSAFYTVAGGGHGHFSDPMVAALTRSFLQQTLGNPRIS
ncbi:MAG: hypothetical protein Fur005_01860 [Roseiflexaceae bacterium]